MSKAKLETTPVPAGALPKKETATAAPRKDFITLASVIAALSVMLLHTNNCFWWMSVGDSRWPAANTIEAVFYFAAPLYFMISGATLMNYRDRYTTGQYFAKRALKILPAFFAAASILSTSSTLIASGFSQKTCFPAAKASTAMME